MTITSSAVVFFIDVDRHQIGEVTKGCEVKYVVGRDEPRDSCQENVSFVKPTGPCSDEIHPM